MTWGTKSNYSTQHLDAGDDSPASAREDIKKAIDELSNVIDGLNTSGGAAKIDTDGKVIVDTAKSTDSNTNITLDPGTDMVKIQNFINLNPVAFANLPSSPANGDVAFLTTDGAGASKNKLCYYETTNNRWNYVVDDSAVATS